MVVPTWFGVGVVFEAFVVIPALDTSFTVSAFCPVSSDSSCLSKAFISPSSVIGGDFAANASKPLSTLIWYPRPISLFFTSSDGRPPWGYAAGTCSTHSNPTISKGKSGSDGAMENISVVPSASGASLGENRFRSCWIWNSRGSSAWTRDTGFCTTRDLSTAGGPYRRGPD